MDIEDFAIVFVTVGVVALAVGVFFAIRSKSIWTGLGLLIYLLLGSALLLGVLGGFSWLINAYRHYVPRLTQIIIDGIVSVLGALTMAGVFIVRGRRSKKAGDLVVNGQSKNAYFAQGAGMLIYFYNLLALMIGNFSRLIDTTPRPYSGGNNFWWIMLICFALYWYYSTEWRGAGFVYRGKVIPFTDVVHARWEKKSLWAKAKLNVKLKNGDQELAFIAPEEMVPAIDKYLRTFFPNP